MAQYICCDGGALQLMLGPEAKEVLGEARRLYEELQRADLRGLVSHARSACARWEFATDEYYSFDPLVVELESASRGRRLKQEPVDSGEYHRFGFAADGGLHFCEHVKTFPFIECKYGTTENTIGVGVGDGSTRIDKLVAVTFRSAFDGERIVARWAMRGWRVMVYELGEEGRPVAVTDWTRSRCTSTLVEYDAIGRLLSLVDAGSGQLQWRRARSGVREMLTWYEARLYWALKPVVEYAIRSLDAITVALAYHGDGGEVLPPQVAATSIRLMRQSEPGSPFDPHNMYGDIRGDEESELRIGDERLLEVGREIGYKAGSDTKGVAVMLRRVAKRLSKETWLGPDGGCVPLSVFVVDLDAGEWDRDFTSCVSARQRRALEQLVSNSD